MKIVVDTNVLFSFFWENSVTQKLLLTSTLELISPKIALYELEKYSDDIIRKTKIKKEKFDELLKKLKLIVKFVDKQEFLDFVKEADKISPDKADMDFFALCLKNNCFLWSNEALLKDQEKIKVISTRDIIHFLY